MDILEILKTSGKDLYPEDLDFFETELATGGHYDAAYQSQCRKLIKQLRVWLNGDVPETKPNPENDDRDLAEEEEGPTGVFLGIDQLTPKHTSAVANQTPEQKFFSDVTQMRGNGTYKSWFKTYTEQQDFIDAAFVDKHFSFFESWEINALISVKQMGEPFLEKYFGALDHDKIALYQLFSEAFFMKHFSQMNYTLVLLQGKNDWRKKENRSKQLDVFLRLKGVKI